MYRLRLLFLVLASLVVSAWTQDYTGARLARRDGPSSTTATGIPSSTSTASGSTGTLSVPPSSTISPSSIIASTFTQTLSSSVSLSTISLDAPTSTSAPLPLTSSASNSTDAADQLPLVSGITPALAVAGVLLLGTGLAYTFVGIQKRWLYVGWSVMYLVSISVTVLLVYVASPPVSNGVQGGYLIAAFLPGCLIAALSTMIFPEVVEGLACLLGGFCLAMWFLCLAPDGLIQSQGGRIGLIIGLSVASYSLWFSHWTRTYGIIICVSFSGATAMVLGIDCFSQAGLKEFWVYVWNLNPRLFPLGTDTYPVTRGIKVEEAVIVVLTAFGIVSQCKLWNVIKERRQRKAQARLQDEEDREHLEANLGRQIEQHNQTEKARWEAIYGDKAGASSTSIFHSVTDSTYDVTGRSKAGSMQGSVVELNELGLEPASRNSKRNSRGEGLRRELSTERVRIRHERKNTLDTLDPAGISLNGGTFDNYAGGSPRGPRPEINPLPFKIPTGSEMLAPDRDDANSLTTADGMHIDADTDRAMPPRKAHTQHNNLPDTTETEGHVPHDDDQASSVDATLNEMTDDEGDGRSRVTGGTPADGQPLAKKTTRRRGSASQIDAEKDKAEAAAVAKRKSMPLFEDLENIQHTGNSNSLYAKATNLSDKLGLKQADATSAIPAPSGPARQVSLKKEFLPESYSNVTQIYRTNEWAKHIFDADQPELDNLGRDKEDPVGVAYQNEKVAPLNMDELQLTATTGQPMARASSQVSLTGNPQYRQLQRALSTNSMTNGPLRVDDPLADRGRPQSREASPARVGMRDTSRSRSQTRLHVTPSPAVYSSPGSLIPARDYTPEESQIDDGAPDASPIESHGSAKRYPPSGTTLLGRRVEKLRSRISTTSFAGGSDDRQRMQRSASASALGMHSSSRISNVYSNFDEPSSTPPGVTARSSMDLKKTSQSINSTPKQSARASMEAKGRSISNPTLLTPYDSQRASLDGNRLPPIQDADDDNISLASHRENLQQQQQLVGLGDDDVPLSQRREMIRRASVNSGNIPLTSEIDTRQRAHGGSPASFKVQNPGVIYDSHQPRRGSSVNQATRESRLAEWRAGMARDASRERNSGFLHSRQQEDSMARIMEERKYESEAEQRRAAQRAAFDRNMEERMRSGSMMQTHREMLSKLQRSASGLK